MQRLRIFFAIPFCSFLLLACGDGITEEPQNLVQKTGKKCYTTDGAKLTMNHLLCPEGKSDMDGRICYEDCKKHYKGVGPVCWKRCPHGYRNDGATCRKPIKCRNFRCTGGQVKAKKSYFRKSVAAKKPCNVRYQAVFNIGNCGRNEFSHCVVRNGQCVWNRPHNGYPLCTRTKRRKANGIYDWKCCPTEFGDTEDLVEN